VYGGEITVAITVVANGVIKGLTAIYFEELHCSRLTESHVFTLIHVVLSKGFTSPKQCFLSRCKTQVGGLLVTRSAIVITTSGSTKGHHSPGGDKSYRY
jgi:hypothetical protein